MAAPPRRSCRHIHVREGAEVILSSGPGPSPLRYSTTAESLDPPSVKSISKQFAELALQDDAKLDGNKVAGAVEQDLNQWMRHPVVAGIIMVNAIAFVCVVLLLQFELFLAPKMAAFVVLRIIALDLMICMALVYRYIWGRPRPHQ